MPDRKIKYLSIKEFRELGYLHEVNRLVLHPLGLALEVNVNNATGEESLGGIWDYRTDPEGVVYGDDGLQPAKAARVAEEIEAKGLQRLRELGFVIQPVDPGVKQLKVSILEPVQHNYTGPALGAAGEYDEGEDQPDFAANGADGA